MRVNAKALRFAASASAIALASLATPSATNAATCNWAGGTDVWTNVVQWSCGAQPGGADDVAILAGGSVVNLNGINAFAGTINLGSGNALNMANSNLFISNAAITNNGIFNITTNSNLINNGGPITVGGTGVLALDDTAGVARIYGGQWIFGSGQTTRGSGQLGINQTIVTNNGLISSDVNTRSLSIDVSGGNGGVGAGNGVGTGGNAGLYNNGIMQATGGGTLNIEGGLYENSATGVIRAQNGSVVSLNGDSRILGGTLTSTGTGVINAHNTTQYLTSVALSSGSNLDVQQDNLYLNTAFTNNGTVKLSNNGSIINETGTLAINGTGTIILDNSGGVARIYGGNITFGAGQTVQGAGQLGINQTTFTINNVFSANAGSVLSIDVSGGNGGVGGGGVGTGGNAGLLNNSTIQATGGSTLNFEGGLYENSGAGIIQALNGSTVNLNGDSRILSGTLTSAGTGVINAHNTTQYLTNVALSSGSNLDVQQDNLYLNTTFTNNGTTKLSNNGSIINETGTLAINGTGTIILDNSGGVARIYGGNITFGAGQTVQGSGQLGINQTTFTINNVFSANTGTTLSIDVSGGNGGVGGGGVGTGGNAGLLNNSTIQATGGSTLNIEGGLYENSVAGVIQALTGSTVNLNGDSRILNGTLTSAGTGIINAHNTSQYLTNVTLSSGSNLDVQQDNLYLNTSFVNNGAVKLSNNGSIINETGSLTITGNGTFLLDNTGGVARIYGGKITFGSGQSVVGSGQLGINQTVVTNNNLFSANSGSNLSIDVSGGNGGVGVGNGVGTNTSSGLLNNNIIEATGNSTISIEGGLYENAANGIIRAVNGSTINLNGDSRILNGTLTSDGTSSIKAYNTSQYLSGVTLASGSNLDVQQDNLYLNTAFTNNGTTRLSSNGSIINETGTLVIDGNGSILLDNSAGVARIYSGNVTFGSNQTVHGAGQIGINQTIVTNNGFITADTGSGISIDVSGGNGGVGAGNGVGTGGNAGLFNTGVLSAVNGSTLSIEGGLYENNGAGLGGEFFVNANSTLVFNGDASYFNLKSGGILDGGRLYAQGYGGTGTMNLRSNAANLIGTIGATGGNATEVILEGAGSVIEVTPFGGGAPVSIDQTLFAVANSGTFALHDRNFTVAANGGNFSNAGLTFVNNTAFAANSFANAGQLISDNISSVNAPITNSGLVHVATGTLTTEAITGSTGTILTDAGATLNLGGTSTAGTLTNNGTLALGTNNITVTSDYTNANFGTGNAFNNHANVTGSGLILAANATMDLSGPALAGGVLNVGNVRTGGGSSTTLTITNNGTLTNLIGAVQNTNAPSIALTGADWTAAANGGSANVGISFTGVLAGALTGQTLNVVNNFDNVASQTIILQGNVYQAAQAGALPASVALGARRVGDAAATSVLTIGNVAPITPGFNEALTANASVGGGFQLNGAGTASVSNLAAGGTAPITLSHLTNVAGAFNSTVNVANTSIAVAGSGLSDLALTGQSVNVTSNVYAAAIANLSGNTVNFGVARQGAASPTGSVNITNGATGALTDSLLTSFSGAPAGVTGTTPGSLGAGQSGNANFTLSTATAGVVSGSGSLNFVSHDAELADVALASQTVSFSGTVTELANASLFLNAGIGTFAGGGNVYTLTLGSFAANSGIYSDDIGVANGIANSFFAETLGGAFAQGIDAGYSFIGNTFSGLAGGSQNIGNLLAFDTTGLASGTYNKTITFNGYSRYAGLNDQSLTPITLNISAQITGGMGAVPESSTWLMMIFGFGLIGGSLRRKSMNAVRATRI